MPTSRLREWSCRRSLKTFYPPVPVSISRVVSRFDRRRPSASVQLVRFVCLVFSAERGVESLCHPAQLILARDRQENEDKSKQSHRGGCLVQKCRFYQPSKEECTLAIRTFTSREFNQNVSAAKNAAQGGPVFVTEQGSPAYVLLSISYYLGLTNKGPSIVELLSMPAAADIESSSPGPTSSSSRRTSADVPFVDRSAHPGRQGLRRGASSSRPPASFGRREPGTFSPGDPGHRACCQGMTHDRGKQERKIIIHSPAEAAFLPQTPSCYSSP